MMSGTQTNTGETMHLAVERFRTQMESANRQFIQDRIDEIEAKNLSTEKEKLDLMRYYWHDLGEKQSGTWLDDAPRDIARRVRETENVSRLEDMKTIFHEHMDGIIPSTLVTDEWRQMFLDIVESVCNEAAEQDDEDENFLIPRCDELGHFIKYANGVQDPDLRRSGICPFDPVPYFGIGDLTSPDGSTVQPQPPTAEFRERIKEQLKDDILGDSFISGAVDEDLEVKVGFQTGLGCHREYDTWYSAYLYCPLRLIPDDENGNLGSELKKFLEYLRYSTKKTNPTYCVEVKSGTGQSLPSDYCLSEYTQCNNKCASAYGPSFVLVSSISDGDRKAAKAAGLKSTQE
ncbi:hypothetical protein E8E15_005271 [Penicillium rubens]|nr:hypothetical protein E8E15_005271 [Penicillium rubens]